MPVPPPPPEDAEALEEARDATRILHQGMPLLAAMQVSVERVEACRVVLSAPLEPNRNAHGTVFGGSLASVGLMSGWLLLQRALTAERLPGTLVVHDMRTRYYRPVNQAWRCVCAIADESSRSRFLATLRTRRRARTDLVAYSYHGQKLVAEHASRYVAVSPEHPAYPGLLQRGM